jgi:homoserine dehydrogenase
MAMLEVLKFGSSVLRSANDLPVAVDEIYRRWRTGSNVLAVVSAFEGETDRLIGDAVSLFGPDSPEALAAYVSTGEQRTAALLTGSLQRAGLPARLIEPREIGMRCEGSCLESMPVGVERAALERFFEQCPILVLPGFYGIDSAGRIALFGRGGSDLSALYLAAEFAAHCRLLKDVRGVFDADPARSANARRFASLTWETAVAVAGPLIQPKALRYARERNLSFEIGRPNGEAATFVGEPSDRWASATGPLSPLRVALAGCGNVGRGVYETLRHYPDRFTVLHVLVRDPAKHADVPEATSDPAALADPSVDVLIECIGGTERARQIIDTALAAGRFVVTANKAVVTAAWSSWSLHRHGARRRLWLDAAVGGALPALEVLATLKEPVREVRGILNGTCGVVLEALAAGRDLGEAVAQARTAGFAEADPARDLSGRDSADKLALLIEAAFGIVIAPDAIPTTGIQTLTHASVDQKLIARARALEVPGAVSRIEASVRLESVSPTSFLGAARGPENRLEIELASGKIIRLRGQGAGRWPTATSVIGDLHEIARHVRAHPEEHARGSA